MNPSGKNIYPTVTISWGEVLRLVPARVLGKDLCAFSSVTQWNGRPTV